MGHPGKVVQASLPIDFKRNDVIWVAGDIYPKSAEALELVLGKLHKLGYEIDNKRETVGQLGEASLEELETGIRPPWYAHLENVRKGQCGSCESLIDTLGIETHGHTCECCGETTFERYVDGGAIEFEFRNGIGRRSLFGPTLKMTILDFDAENGYLYFRPGPIEGGWRSISQEEYSSYMAENAHMWDEVVHKGEVAIRVRHSEERLSPIDTAINRIEVEGSRYNFKIVRVWEGKIYPGHNFGKPFPAPESISIYEPWRWAPLEPSPVLYEKILHAVGQMSDGHWAEMGIFVRHFTTLDADKWDVASRRFPASGPKGIQAVMDFCSPESIEVNRPNIGNLLSAIVKVTTGKYLSEDELRVALAAEKDPAAAVLRNAIGSDFELLTMTGDLTQGDVRRVADAISSSVGRDVSKELGLREQPAKPDDFGL